MKKLQSSALLQIFTNLQWHKVWKQNKDSLPFLICFRRQPFTAVFIFAGLDSLFELLEKFRFSTDDLDYLQSLNIFEVAFKNIYQTLNFSGEIYAMEEGFAIFPKLFVLRVMEILLNLDY